MKKRILSIIMSAIMTFGVIAPQVIVAEAEDITSQGLTIAATDGSSVLEEGTDYSYSNGKWLITTVKPVTISMKSGASVTDDYIVIDATNGKADVTLNGISIENGDNNIIEVLGEHDTTIRAKGKNTLVSTSTSSEEGIYSAKSELTVVGENGGELIFEGVYSGIRGYYKPISLEGNLKLKVKDVTFGVFLSPYSSYNNLLRIHGNINVEASEVKEHAIYNKYGKIDIKAENGEKMKFDLTTDAWGIYGHGIDMSGTIEIEIDSEDDGAIYSGGENNPINLSGNIAINIDSVDNGITAKGDISIDNGVKIEKIVTTNGYSYGINCENLVINDSEVNIESNGYAAITADTVTVCGDSKVELVTDVDTTSSRYGIKFEGTLDVQENAEVEVKVIGQKTYAIYGSTTNRNDTVDVKDNAKLILDGGVRTVYYAENVTVTDDAEFTIKNAEEYGIYKADLNASGNAKVIIDSREYGVRVENGIVISNNAEVLVTGSDKAIYSSNKYQVTPDTNNAYEVSIGETKDTAEMTTYYETSGEQSTKSGMTYFHAASKTPYETTNIAVDYRNEKLTGFKTNAKYTVNDVDKTLQDGALAIDEEWFDTIVKISQKGDEFYAASKPQEIAISARPNAPTISGEYEVSEKDKTKFVYTVNPVENAEYKMDDGNWQDGNVFEGIEPLSSHTFSIRIKATDILFASKITDSATITFEKLDGTGTVSMEDWAYGNDAKEPVPSSDTNGTEKVTYVYKRSGAEDSTYSGVRPTKPGTYTIKAIFAETETYKEVVATTEFIIKKADKIIGNVPNVDHITDKNVKVEDKKKLEDAKTALEKNLEANKENYTDDLKNAIQKEMKRIEDLLNTIKKQETVHQFPLTGDVKSMWIWVVVILLSSAIITMDLNDRKKIKK